MSVKGEGEKMNPEFTRQKPQQNNVKTVEMARRGRPVTVDRSYMQDAYAQKWLMGLSENTKGNYAKYFLEWLTFIKLSPKQQIQKRLSDTKSIKIDDRTFFESKFREYKEILEEEKATHGTVLSYLKVVANFFSRNGLPLALKRGDWSCTNPKHNTAKAKMWIPSQEDAKRLYAHANLRDKALFLVLYQSGFSEVDVRNLRIEDITEGLKLPEIEHFYIQKNREKTNIEQATCISCEALHDLREYLTERRNPSSGYLFEGQTKSKGQQIEVRTINEAMKTLVSKAFGVEKVRVFKTKALRSAYNSALLRASIQPQELKDVLMGHQRGSARKNYAYDEQTIKENYAKAFQFLCVNGIQTKNDLAKLKDEFTKTKTEFAEIIVKLT
jgi:integrase